MSKSIYDKTIKSLSFYQETVTDLINKKPINRIDLTLSLDQNKITSEFDLLKKEFPDTYKKYLTHLLNNYEWIDHTYDNTFIPNNLKDKENVSNVYSITDENGYIIDYLSRCLKHIILHLKGLLNPESVIQEQKQVTKDLNSLLLSDFLDAITEKKNIYEISIDNDHCYTGNKSQIESFLPQLSAENRSLINSLLNDKEEYSIPFEFTLIEIYNYLEKLTSNFDPIKVKTTLFDIEVYYSMEFLERIDQESLNIYQRENWEIPKIKIKPPFKENEEFQNVTDYGTMRKKTHLFSSMGIDYAISILKNKLNENNIEKKKVEVSISEFDQLFSNNGKLLFQYLDTNYTKDNISLKAKYSYIYHFLKYENKLSCNQNQYLDFIKKSFDVNMSKIQPQNIKYSDDIQSLLGRLMIEFNKSK